MLRIFRKIHDKESSGEEIVSEEISFEVVAVIAAAMQIILSEEDSRKHVLTIKRIQKSYSPWSSKIYMLRQVPNQFYKR